MDRESGTQKKGEIKTEQTNVNKRFKMTLQIYWLQKVFWFIKPTKTFDTKKESRINN